MDAVFETIQNVLFLLAGLGVMIFGMRTMSKGLEASAGKGMQRLFARISGNRFAAVGVGAAMTAIVQSSAATSVVVIGFVNAGLMTLNQATGILMGANIGTTMTAVLVSIKDVIGIVSYLFMALALAGAFVTMFGKHDRTKRIGTVLSGVGFIFVGLEIISLSINGDANIANALATVFTTIRFPLLLILVGILATALMQSSAVVTAIVIMLAGQNSIPMQSAFFIVLGSNIGTCISALLASSGTSVNAKRAAFIMILFNVTGVVIFTPIVWIFGNAIETFLRWVSGNNPTMMVAFFHVGFNLITTFLLIGFIKQIVALSCRVVKDKPVRTLPDKLYFLDKRILSTPQLAVAQMMKEVIHMAHLAEQNFDRSVEYLFDPSVDYSEEIAVHEHEINYLNKAVTNYLVLISSLNITDADEKLIGSLYHVVSDIERIGDHAENFGDIAKGMRTESLRFSGTARAELLEMYKHIKLLYKDAMYCFTKRSDALFENVNTNEELIDRMRKDYEQHHVERLKAGECTVETGAYFNSCTTNFERVADHLTNIAYSINPPKT